MMMATIMVLPMPVHDGAMTEIMVKQCSVGHEVLPKFMQGVHAGDSGRTGCTGSEYLHRQ